MQIDIRQQWDAIISAPIPYLSAILVVGISVWVARGFMASNRIGNLEERIRLRDDEIADYKRKLDGASPDEAKARIEALERKLDALAPRTLRAEQRAAIVKAASISEMKFISIAADGGSTDSQGFARVLSIAFQGAGWQTSLPMVLGIGNPPPSGIGINVSNPNALTVAESVVVSALQAAGLEFDVMRGRGPREGMPGDQHYPVELTITNSIPI